DPRGLVVRRRHVRVALPFGDVDPRERSQPHGRVTAVMSRCVYLVTGAQGQLGRAVVSLAKQRGRTVMGVDVAEMPLESRGAIARVVAVEQPRFVVHCGAIRNVDGWEAERL